MEAALREIALPASCAVIVVAHSLLLYRWFSLQAREAREARKPPPSRPRPSPAARPAKEYDRSLRTLEEEQGAWYVNNILERELARLYRYYARESGPAAGAGYDDSDSEECDCPCHEDLPDCDCEDGCSEECDCPCHADCDDDCECRCHDEDDADDADEEDEDEGEEDEDEDADADEDDEDEDDEDADAAKVVDGHESAGDADADTEGDAGSEELIATPAGAREKAEKLVGVRARRRPPAAAPKDGAEARASPPHGAASKDGAEACASPPEDGAKPNPLAARQKVPRP